MKQLPNKLKTARISLSVQLNLLIVCGILIVSAGLVAISYHFYSEKINSVYMQQLEQAALVNSYEIFPEFIEYFWSWIDTDEFREVREEAAAANDEDLIREWMRSKPSIIDTNYIDVFSGQLDEIMDDFSDIEVMSLLTDYESIMDVLDESIEYFDITYAYIQVGQNGETYTVVDPDASFFLIGTPEEKYEEFKDYPENSYVPPTIYKYSEGWFCTHIRPLMPNADGRIVGVVGVDQDMNLIIREKHLFLIKSAAYVLTLTLVTILVSMYLLNRTAVKPLRQLAQATMHFGNGDNGYTKEDVVQIPERFDDEISDLYRDVRSMELRIIDYTENLTRATSERERTRTELQTAERIQRSMLPTEFSVSPNHQEFDLYASMNPAKEVGGDFYDFFLLDDDHLALVIADVSDKGVPAALFMMANMILIRYRACLGGTPAEILTEVNRQICASNKTKMFVTVWLGILDLKTGCMTCTNAGHEYPFIRGRNGIYRMLKDKHGLVLGGLPKTIYTDYEVKLEPGDAVFVYTDGVPEAADADGRFYGMDRLGKSLNQDPMLPSKEIIGHIKADVDAFVNGASQFDDITMLAVEYRGRKTDPAES